MHVLIAVGSLVEWSELTDDRWLSLLNQWVAPLARPEKIRATVAAKPAGRLTITPYENVGSEMEASGRVRLAECLNLSLEGGRLTGELCGVPTRIELNDSGAVRLAEAGRALVERKSKINEAAIDAELLGDAGEPDLVIACGESSHAVPSLVWELAYSEIVYLPIDWRSLSSSHIDDAIRDFHNRNRRFGGV